MKKVLLALLGLILLAVLAFFCFQDKAAEIQNDLVSSTTQTLHDNDLSSVHATLNGEGYELTDIIRLTGEVPTQEAKAKAASLASSVLGVGGVDNQLYVTQHATAVAKMPTPTVKEPVKHGPAYTLTITKDANEKIVLEGSVDSDAAKSTLLEKAHTLFGKTHVVDKLVVKAHAPKDWEHISAFALEKLKDVDYGDMKLVDNSYEFTGHLPSPSSKADFLNGIRVVMSDPKNKYGRYRGDYIITAPVKDVVVAKKEVKKVPPVIKKIVPVKKKAVVVEKEIPAEDTFIISNMTPHQCQEEVDSILQDHKILFDNDKASIKQGSYFILDSILQTLQTCQAASIQIAGHTDSVGRQSYNQQLSQRRAKSVKHYLVKQGFDSRELQAVGYGESQPIASNKTRAGRAKNRRIEFIVKGVK